MLLGILYFLYIVNCLILVFFILLQQSRGGGLAGAFGGGGSETLFGYTSMQKIGHYTIYAAVLFMLLSVLIAHYPYQQESASVVDFSDNSGGVPIMPEASSSTEAPAPSGQAAQPPSAPAAPE